MSAPTGRKDDATKTRLDLVWWPFIRDVADVLTAGAAHYGDDNWRRVDRARDRYFAAAMRHLIAWYGGESRDPESGHPHLAHAAASLMFLAWFERGDR